MKHIGMTVSYNHIKKLVPAGFSLAVKGDQIGVAVNTIGWFYCDRATLFGLCPKQCELCDANLRRMLDLRNAKSPMGLLVWLAKDAAASLRDQAADKKKPAENHVPTSELEQTNPFLDILQGL